MNIPIVRRVLEKNEQAAAENRARFDRLGLFCVNVLGGAGCGKTALLEAILPRLRGHLAAAVLEGDLATTRDAERIAALGVPVVQLLTDGGCHLTAPHVCRAIDALSLDELDLLLIENIGNPICPSNFDLGEHARIAVLSVTEGDDKPSKYPLLFRRADLVVITKCDLLPHVNFHANRAIADIRRVNPFVEIVRASPRYDQGIERLADWIAMTVQARGARRRNPLIPSTPEVHHDNRCAEP